MAITKQLFQVGERVVVEVHGANYPEGTYEGVVESREDYNPNYKREGEPQLYLYRVRFDDHSLALSEQWRTYNGQTATGNSNLYPIEVMRLFHWAWKLKDDLSTARREHAVRERALLDAIKVAGKDSIIEAIEGAAEKAVYAAVERVFDPVKTSLRALASRVEDLNRIGFKVFQEDRAALAEQSKQDKG